MEPEVTNSVTWNVVVITDGAVKKKLKVVPPLLVVNTLKLPPLGPYVGEEKSVETPVVAPPAFRTVTVQQIISLIRTRVMDRLVRPTQVRTEVLVGIPRTANENEDPDTATPPLSFSVTKNTGVITLGAVKINLSVDPEFGVLRLITPLPPGP
jgi:hypothetical protein